MDAVPILLVFVRVLNKNILLGYEVKMSEQSSVSFFPFGEGRRYIERFY